MLDHVLQAVHRNGQLVPVVLNVVELEFNARRFYAVIMNDNSSRRHAKQERLERHARVRTLCRCRRG